jgi:hypothetical protein
MLLSAFLAIKLAGRCGERRVHVTGTHQLRSSATLERTAHATLQCATADDTVAVVDQQTGKQNRQSRHAEQVEQARRKG